MVAPIAKIFGVPMSAIGGSAASSEEMKGEDKGKAEGAKTALTWEEKLLEAIAGDHGTIALFGKLFKAITEHPIFKGVKAVAKGLLGAVGSFFGFSEGGYVPGRAMGGWISGPQSGYPVSLDGGMTTSFIGHGTEWVGMKGFSGGGAFVVPFDTPATRQNPGLTSQRMGEAMRGGYSMPRFSKGGFLPKFSAGGKFDPKAYAKDSFEASRVVLNDKSYYVTYAYEGDPSDAKISIKSMSKRTKAGFLGMGEERIGVEPGTDEFKAVMNSAGLKTDIANRHKSKPNARGRGSKPANITQIKIHPKATKFYEYNKSYQDAKASGLSNKEAAEKAAKDNNTVTEADRQAAKDKTESKTDSKENESVDEKIKRLFGKDGALSKGLTEMAKNVPATGTTNTSGAKVEEAQQKKTEAKLDNLRAMTAQRDAAMQPFVQESQAPPIMGGGGDEIIVPTYEKNDADEYLLGKFGLIAEARSTLANFM